MLFEMNHLKRDLRSILGGGNEVKQVNAGGATSQFPNGTDHWYDYPAVASANNTFEYNTLDTCGFECDDTVSRSLICFSGVLPTMRAADT